MREGRDRVSQSESGERQIERWERQRERDIREKEETEGKDRERERKKERKIEKVRGGTFCELILSEIFLRTNGVYVYK